MSAIGVVLATLGGLALFHQSGHAASSAPAVAVPVPLAAPSVPVREEPSRPPAAASSERAPTMRMQFMAEAEKRGANLRTEADLDRELAALEERARNQGQVTALEVETGLLLIERMQHALPAGKNIQKRAEFTARLERILLKTEP
ncbi:MAG TPA: hypothetical protein VFZ53_21550 [Polyangiaceae bacterium]